MTAYLPPFIALLVSVGIFIAYIHPTYTKDIAGLKSEIENYNRAHVAATDYLSKQAEIAEKMQAISNDDVERLKAFLPDGVDNVQLIVDLTALAQKSGVTLSGIDVSAAAANLNQAPASGPSDFGFGAMDRSGAAVSGQGPVESLDLSLRFSSSYPQLIAFLSAIESSLRPLDVTNLSLQSNDQGTQSVTMTLRVYWLR